MAEKVKKEEFGVMSFETAMAELEQIVAKLEKGDVELEESIAIYERGEALRARGLSTRESFALDLDRLIVPAAREQHLEQLLAQAGALGVVRKDTSNPGHGGIDLVPQQVSPGETEFDLPYAGPSPTLGRPEMLETRSDRGMVFFRVPAIAELPAQHIGPGRLRLLQPVPGRPAMTLHERAVRGEREPHDRRGQEYLPRNA